MIVLDEQLMDPRLKRAIEKWYSGAVLAINDLRPRTQVLDDVVSTLLQQVKQPTFVTINHSDFWRIIPAHPAYCVSCFKLPIEQSLAVSEALRDVLRMPEWRVVVKLSGMVDTNSYD